jgi:ferrous iron transport protein B
MSSIPSPEALPTELAGGQAPTVAIAGNPNCGKTSIFNALTGSRHHVANWPGVTVEKRYGHFNQDGVELQVVDLPGTYSLSAQSEDERIAAAFIAEPAVDVIVNVLDASNLERNLYLTTQVLEMKKPMVFVLNMMDDAERQGVTLDIAGLQTLLGGPVVPTVGNRGDGVPELQAAILSVARGGDPRVVPVRASYGGEIEAELAKLEREIGRDEQLAQRIIPRWLAIGLLERAPDAVALAQASHAAQAIETQRASSSQFLEKRLGSDAATLIAERRYGFAHGLVSEVLNQSFEARHGWTTRVDQVLTHKWFGLPIFLVIMAAMYSLTFILGSYPQDWITAGFSWLHDLAAAHLPTGELTSLLVDGVIPGVGAVVVFVPVIMILMGCISFLEDTGYMSRAAFMMDRLMHLMGLHGKSFIPLIMGTGCNVPAVQATRTIESRTDRFITILAAPLVSCSARLQVYILIAGTFFKPVPAALVIIALHVLGFGLAMVVGKVLRLTLFRGETTPFVMELPPYRMPVLKATAIHMWEKGRLFLTRAGTVILAGATLVWFLSHYPGITNKDWVAERQVKEEAIHMQNLAPAAEKDKLEELDLESESRIMNSSLAARFGHLLQPALAPILDPDHKRPEAWKDGVALTAGFAAKEIVVGTMGVLNQAKAEKEGDAPGMSPLQESLKEHSGFTALTAFAFLVFILIYTPCLGLVGMILKETRSLAWTSFSVAYGLGLAWIMAWGTVTIGRLCGFA